MSSGRIADFTAAGTQFESTAVNKIHGVSDVIKLKIR